MATLGLSPTAMSWRRPQVLAPEQARLHVRGVKAPPLLDGRQGLPRLAPVEHARRLPLQRPLHGPVHVAVPVEGQEAHGACSFAEAAAGPRPGGPDQKARVFNARKSLPELGLEQQNRCRNTRSPKRAPGRNRARTTRGGAPARPRLSRGQEGPT